MKSLCRNTWKKTSIPFLSAISGSFLVLAICELFRGFHLLIALVWVLEIDVSGSLGHGRSSYQTDRLADRLLRRSL
jgi:hypothetical protein